MFSFWKEARLQGAIWGLIRVWLGWSWLQAGWEKLTVESDAWIGSKAGSSVTGFLQGAVKKATGEHPAVHPWYGSLASNFLIPNATLFSYLVTFGEFLVGIALIIGLFTRFSAAMGMTMNLAFLFAGSTSTNTEMLLFEAPIAFAGMYAGYYGLDHYVMPYLRRLFRPTHDDTVTKVVTRMPNIETATTSATR